MSRLEKLAQMISSLPEIELERERIAIADRVSQYASESAQGLAAAYRQAPHIDILTQGKMVTITKEAITFSIEQGKSLKKLIRRENFGSEQKISGQLENISKKLQAVENQKKQVWTTVQGEVQTVEKIQGIATKLGLESVPALTEAVSNFQAATASPPSSIAEVERILEARKANERAIANSGLSGNVQKILEGAINQKGDPRLLLEAEVQKFFNEHPTLWEILKLRLA